MSVLRQSRNLSKRAPKDSNAWSPKNPTLQEMQAAVYCERQTTEEEKQEKLSNVIGNGKRSVASLLTHA